MPALETAPPSQTKQVIWKGKKRLAFHSASRVKKTSMKERGNSQLRFGFFFFRCNEDFSDFPHNREKNSSSIPD